MSEPENHDLSLPEGAVTFMLVALAALGVTLFFIGTQKGHYDFTSPLGAGHEAVHDAVGPAPTYRQLRDTPRGTSSGIDADLAALSVPTPAAGTVADALAARASLRSYDGAPPRIPHAVRQDAAPECLSCHEDGLTLRGRSALAMSHTELTSCTQCHVVAQAPMPGGEALPPDPRDVPSSFVGMASPDHGPRAWSIAPPQVPHKVFMRERCESCHGDLGRGGMQTPHPWRDNCEQCHAGPAEVDQRPGVKR